MFRLLCWGVVALSGLVAVCDGTKYIKGMVSARADKTASSAEKDSTEEIYLVARVTDMILSDEHNCEKAKEVATILREFGSDIPIIKSLFENSYQEIDHMIFIQAFVKNTAYEHDYHEALVYTIIKDTLEFLPANFIATSFASNLIRVGCAKQHVDQSA